MSSALVSRLTALLWRPPRTVLAVEHLVLVVLAYSAAAHVRRRGIRGTASAIAAAIIRGAKRLPGAAGVVDAEKRKTLEKIEEFVLGHDDEPLENTCFTIPEHGWNYDRVVERMDKLRQRQSRFNTGRAFGGIYHKPEDRLVELQVEAYRQYSCTNALYPGVFPGVRKFEAELVSMLVRLLNGSGECCGSLTSGGTESVLCMLKAYRDYARKERGIQTPEIICSHTAHPALDKAAQYFDVVLVRVPVTPDQRIDVAAARRAITRNTVGIYASAPTFPHGVVDPIEELGQLAQERRLLLHVDNCFGGFLLSFLQQQRLFNKRFDFLAPGVSSISVDVHKYGFASKGASAILYRTHALRQFQYSTVADWSGGLYATPTMQGSRPGGIIASAWATVVYMGVEGYARSAREIHRSWMQLRDGVLAISGLKIVGEPDACALAIGSDTINIYQVADALTERGWEVTRLQHPPSIQYCVAERLHDVIPDLLRDLREAVRVCRDSPEQVTDGLASIYGAAATVPDRTIVQDILAGYLDALYLLRGSAPAAAAADAARR